ncbi:MAG: hypothetical protein ACQEXJ_23590 [Myxococcota bacterium]
MRPRHDLQRVRPRRGSARRLAVLVVAAGLLLAGCRDGGFERFGADATPEPPGHEPATTAGDFDREAMREALQGDWVVRRDERTLFEFRIGGEEAAVVDHRFSKPRVREGDLVLRSPTGFGVEMGDGTTWYYSFVRTEERVFMGLGAAIEAPRGEPFTAKLGAWEKLVYDGEECLYVRTWAGEETEEVVECGFEERGERRVFYHEGPDPFREDRTRRRELYVEGDYLLERDLALATVERVDEDEGEPAADADASPGEPSEDAEEPGADAESPAPDAGPGAP